jgi:polyisoprenoid-binding protein YceI
MKIWNLALSGAIVATMLASCGGNTEQVETTPAPTGATGVYAVQTDASNVKWEGNMLAVGGVSLYGHYGNVAVSKGELTLNDGKVQNGMVVIDMTTIKPMDEGYQDVDGGRATDLVGHLSSPDFFNVAEYPTAEFVVKEHTEAGLVGTLTVRGISQEEVIENVTIDEVDGKLTASGKLTFDRQQFDAKFAMPVADKILSDDVVLNITVVAAKG